MQIPARFYLAKSSQVVDVNIEFVGQHLSIYGLQSVIQSPTDQNSFDFELAQLNFPPVLADLPREILLPDGSKLEVSDGYNIESYFKTVQGYRLLYWFEKNKLAWLLAIILVPMTFYCLVQVIIPAAARSVTPLVPYAMIKQIDQQALFALDKLTLKPSQLSHSQQASVDLSWQQAVSILSAQEGYTLNFRASEFYGANAFALPGGNIVITDDLVELLVDQPQALTAIFLHEIAHVEYRHGLQMIAEATGISLLMIYFFGDLEVIAELFSGTVLTIIQNQFSQRLETEADSFTFQKLAELNISPSVFADALSTLVGADGKSELSKLEQYLSTHPSIKERVDKALASIPSQ